MTSHYDYLLIGSFACVHAAQSIREQDKEGTILIIGEEPHPPYDRPPLSKDYLTDDDMTPDGPYSKYDDFYSKNQIALHTKTRVKSIDRAARSITTDSGERIGYGKLLLATGARAKTLDIPGADRPGVFLLRHIEDAEAIRQALRVSKRAVIIGAGYIGMEVAAAARQRGLDVTVIDPGGRPWSRFASENLGGFLKRYYEAQGVQFIFEEVASIDGAGEHSPVHRVTTKQGRQLPADLVVAGVGAALNIELAKEAGLEADEKNGVRVDAFLRTADPNVWAAGDIAYFHDIALGKDWHAEHFQNAKWQGQAAGKVMAGGTEPYDQIPYFFSDEFDIHMILRGDPQGGKSSLFLGDVDGAEFTELYYNEEGVVTMGVAISHDEKKLDALAETLERLVRKKVNIKGRETEIQSSGFDLAGLA